MGQRIVPLHADGGPLTAGNAIRSGGPDMLIGVRSEVVWDPELRTWNERRLDRDNDINGR